MANCFKLLDPFSIIPDHAPIILDLNMKAEKEVYNWIIGSQSDLVHCSHNILYTVKESFFPDKQAALSYYISVF